MFEYNEEVIVLSGPFKDKRGVFVSSDGIDCKVVMYHPVYGTWTFDRGNLKSTRRVKAGR